MNMFKYKMDQNLIFASASFHISLCDIDQRENEYYYCLKQLLRVVPKNFEIVVCDNTINKIDDIKLNTLKNILLNNVKFVILNRNIGEKNIGIGELDELIHVSTIMDFKKYNKIVYLTLRKFISNSYVFEKVNNMSKDALLSNPPFLHIDGNNSEIYFSNSTPNLYNDMFFSLSSTLMNEYVNYSKLNLINNLKNGVGSEQNLFNFVNEYKIDYEWLEYLGFIRIDYKKNNEIQII